MAVMNPKALATSIKNISTNATKMREAVQEALVSAAYYAFKDGDTGPFNHILDAVGNGTHKKGITMWIEICAGIGRVKDGKIVLNKKVRGESAVTDEASFAEYEAEMRKVAWHEIAGVQKAESVFEATKYIDNVIKKLERENCLELANMIRQTELAYRIQLTKESEDTV